MTTKTVRFTTNGSSSTFGNFAAGDLLKTSPEHASHLVDVARCAVYATDKTETEGQIERPRGMAASAAARVAAAEGKATQATETHDDGQPTDTPSDPEPERAALTETGTTTLPAAKKAAKTSTKKAGK